ncbi:MAG: formate dehydrogenase family accessory protein FdhD [Candidatus Tectomicrobia bacterium RIFCSPLOWO2_02_FULL_70_19]|nr:MAG: formate dehydrogenase family accessory protein FdhD [Candidatus Tectomicrobia bacterium RIFCSPLOWO2_02_FULL_70_19]
MMDGNMDFTIYRYANGVFSPAKIPVVREIAFRILVENKELATLMCTPLKLRELALGFLAFERVIDSLGDVKSLEVDENEFEAHVELNRPLPSSRPRILTSGCAGGVTFHLDVRDYAPIRAEGVLNPDAVPSLMHQLIEAAELYHQSRGIHAAALFDGEGLIAVAEDIGRHNTLDKLRGEVLVRGIDPREHILASSGRISSEMLRKAAQMKVPFVISRTSPTSLSIDLAKRLGITLIGYVTHDQFTVYAHPEGLASGTGSCWEGKTAWACSDASSLNFGCTKERSVR